MSGNDGQTLSGADLDWQKSGGLLPAVVQDADSGVVLMLGYMNQEALSETTRSGRVTFYSRSKDRLWQKGETSGDVLELVSWAGDCDRDTILVKARPSGPVCHQGTPTCFGDENDAGLSFIQDLFSLLQSRYEERPEGSYTTKLFEKGLHKVAQKVGEEGVETALAAKDDDPDAFLGEVADLTYHLLALLVAKGHSPAEVIAVLKNRHGGRG